MPGGHVDFGEDLTKGLRREVSEELHRNISIGDPFHVFDYLNDIKGSHSVEISYFAVFTDTDEVLVLHPEDHASACWMTEDDVCNLEDTSDEERKACLKGFLLLHGERHDTGTPTPA